VKTLFNEPKTASQAAYIARIQFRADVLFTDAGYTLHALGDHRYSVVKPGCEAEYPFGDYGYDVDNAPGSEDCNCAGFIKDSDCKHRIACALYEEALLKAEADACEMDVESYLRWKEYEQNRAA
jgi:hypothetical protein